MNEHKEFWILDQDGEPLFDASNENFSAVVSPVGTDFYKVTLFTATGYSFNAGIYYTVEQATAEIKSMFSDLRDSRLTIFKFQDVQDVITPLQVLDSIELLHEQ